MSFLWVYNDVLNYLSYKKKIIYENGKNFNR